MALIPLMLEMQQLQRNAVAEVYPDEAPWHQPEKAPRRRREADGLASTFRSPTSLLPRQGYQGARLLE